MRAIYIIAEQGEGVFNRVDDDALFAVRRHLIDDGLNGVSTDVIEREINNFALNCVEKINAVFLR